MNGKKGLDYSGYGKALLNNMGTVLNITYVKVGIFPGFGFVLLRNHPAEVV
jgi:hypothetical protein